MGKPPEALRTPAGWYGQYESPLYPYQLEFATAAEQYIADCRAGRVDETPPLVFMVSRQGGKNETSARLEVRLLCKYANASGSNNLIKTAPTYKPTLVVSMLRLEQALKPLKFLYERFVPSSVTKRWQQQAGTKTKPIWRKSMGYIYTLGNARCTFLSGQPGANKVGDTASLGLEIDEAQAFSREVFRLEFGPMLSTRNCPAIFYGTSWIRDNLLEEMRELARSRQKKFGRRLLFEFPWEVVAEFNPHYRKNVLEVIRQLGEDHPVVLSQYCLKPITQYGRLFGPQLLALLRGDHPRRFKPKPGKIYVAGVDLSGATEGDGDPLRERTPRDSTVVTIAELLIDTRGLQPLPVLQVVDHLHLSGVHPLSGVDRLCHYVFEHWGCLNCVVDEGGVGHQVARAMEMRYPGRCVGLPATDENVSRLGNALLGAINTGRLKMYRSSIGPGDWGSSPDEFDQVDLVVEPDKWESDPAQVAMVREFWLQMLLCEREYTWSGKMRFQAPEKRVDGKPVHDDFPRSLAYLVEAGAAHIYAYGQRDTPGSASPWEWGAGYG